MAIETREVLATAYKARAISRMRPMLSHAVEVDADRHAIRVLCGRVNLESIADRYAQDTTLPPTCRRCAKSQGRDLPDRREG